ncbi:DMT family transporter [Alkalicoccobacillus gibsonii]|uniref:DMT family transporter n=1 Tax=Alkalicoccobacillus gibsonii TaxID=79881 RepID=UPI003F7BFB1A
MVNKSVAIIVGVFVTVLWSSSYIVNAWAFDEGVGPLTLAGARYVVAAIVLTVVVRSIRLFENREYYVKSTLSWRIILLLGLTGYLMAQGLQYAGQFYMTPTQTSLFLSIGNTSAVLLVDHIYTRESRSRSSIYAILVLSVGVLTYFYPWELKQISFIGISLVLFSSIGYALNLTINRSLLRHKVTRTEDLIIFPMLIGAMGLLGVGLTIEDLPSLTPKLVLLILWLGSVNGALAFYLWTWTQKHLKAFESSLLNNLMLIEIALLDVLFLQRQLSLLQVFGILFVAVSIAYVQIRPLLKKRRESTL